MDALFAMNRAGFSHLMAHISLYREESSPEFSSVAANCMKDCKLDPQSMSFWDVPGMGQILGKLIPLEVHGKDVFVDEEKLAKDEGTTHGLLRFALLSGGTRVKHGGRARYDFMTMNITLAVGSLSGASLMYIGKRRWRVMQRPYLRLFISAGAFLVTAGITRAVFSLLGVGVLLAQKEHKQAASRLACRECLQDVMDFSSAQVEELKHSALPPPQPGMPPPPPEYVKKFEKGVKTQSMLLERDLEEMNVLLRNITSSAKRSGSSVSCEVHTALALNPEASSKEIGQPIFPRDRELARMRGAAGGGGGVATSGNISSNI